jgi:hypothetical protein
MTLRAAFTAVLAGNLLAGVAAAQMPQQLPQKNDPLHCYDFQHNPDGSWSPRHQVSLNGETLDSGVAVPEGVAFGGVDLAGNLNRYCS